MKTNASLTGLGRHLVLAGLIGAGLQFAQAAETAYQADKISPPTHVEGGTEFGDEVTLAGGFAQVPLEQFDFSYYVSARFLPSASKTITVTFYAMDGPEVAPGRPSPGTVLFQSTPVPLVRSASGNVDVSVDLVAANGGSPVWVPSNFGWVITLNGLGPTDLIGLWSANAVVGDSLNDYWVKTGGSWGLATVAGGAVPGTFAATVLAVPEPTVSQLGFLGLLFLFGSRWLKRR
ncbi:MAG: hypothetical protein D6766_05180 [Verrucomicrobia bacterium]|nr:MAG: hypothetical protein D6766_05180 [Verrucomicrobiota bacterium]